MSVGKLQEFDVESGAWTTYVDRLEMFFKVNLVKEDMKVPTLITVMGDRAYQLLENLASPTKPSDLTWEQVSQLMCQHLQPIPSALAERYKFRQRRQSVGENISTYVAELKRLTRYCNFGASLNENLRDQFICGLYSDSARQRLFAEEDSVTFVNAVRLALSLEAAERDAAIVEPSKNGRESSGEGALHAVNPLPRERARGSDRSSTRPSNRILTNSSNQRIAPKKEMYCDACGARSHNNADCRFRNYVCSKCHEGGHLRRVCPQWSGAASSGARAAGPRGALHFGDADRPAGEEDGGDIEEELHHLCLNNYQAVSLPIIIENSVVQMEVDTGSAISCVSKTTYEENFSHIPLESDNIVLRFYDGSKIKPLGVIKPWVSYNGCRRQLELFVINGGTVSLLGRHWLTELQIDIPKFNCNFLLESKDVKLRDKVNGLVDRFKDLFSGGLGRYTGGKATLRVREGAVPVFHRARPLPYALRERVDAELDAMLRDGIIEPVDCSDWASPLVPINKPDGSLRLCADYKVTLNPSLLVDRYPLPKIEDVLVKLNGNVYFSKLDLSQAYNQIELDDSRKFTVINTHRGLFRYNRLVFGLSSSVGIFQRIMSNLLGSIPNVQVFLDDVIIGGKTETEHLRALEEVFRRLLQYGLKLKSAKCVFLAKEVSYLGYIVSREGIKPDMSKVSAIIKMKRPGNVSELRSFLGMVNFFGKFIRNLSPTLSPLYNLLRKGVEWDWSSECERSFTQVKSLLSGTKLLAHYDPKKKLIVTCDASAQGVGAVLSVAGAEGERPVAYASRTLSTAEANYSQIHREALAIIFSVKKFHQYLYGRHFTLRTDHKPLVSIFGPNTGVPTMTASRMQRWAVILSAYDYDIEYVSTSNNCADGLSRLPNAAEPIKSSHESIPEQTYLHFAQEALLLDYHEIKRHTTRDPVLTRILSYIRDGWPEQCDIEGMRPFFNRKSELYEELGCVMWGHRVVIPEGCRTKVLQILHEPHMGIVKTKALARSYVWWAGVDEAVERVCRECATCAALADAPPQHAPRSWPWPRRPWTRVHIDFLGPLYGKTYLVVVDAMSKWLEIFEVPSTAASATIRKLSELWARWGIPKQVVSDNGPPFTSCELAKFLESDGVDHLFSAPYHPSSNGAAENAVKTIKRVIKKAVLERKDIQRSINNFLLYYRNIGHCSTGESPAVLLMGRRLRTRLDVLKPDRERQVSNCQKRQAEAAGGSERRMTVGQDVWYRQFLKGEKWLPGRIVKVIGCTDYNVIGADNKEIHRHIDQLRRRVSNSLACTMGIPPVESRPAEVAEPLGPSTSSARCSLPQGERNEECFSTPQRVPELEEHLSTPGSGLGLEAAEQPTPSTPVPARSRPVRSTRNANPLYKT